MAENTIKIKIDVDEKPIKSLKAELRETVQALQQAELGTDAFDRLNARAAELKDKMAEVNEQIAVFATGSKYEQVGNSLGEISAGIMGLDFDRAEQGAKLFAKTAGSITFKDAIGSLQSLGKTFVSVGKTILTNPLFLIAAVVAAIVAAVVALLDEMGILDKIFKAVGDAIGFVIQKLKDMLDWLGLTNYAEKDQADKAAKNQEKIAQSHEKKRDAVIDSYDHEIRMAKIAGKNTTDLERQKQHAIIKTNEAQAEALQAQILAMRAAGTLTAEKAKEIRGNITELKNGIREARQEIQGINAQEVADNKAANEKKSADNRAAAAAAKERRKQDAADRLAALRAIQDAELSIMAEGQEKEIKENKLKYQRLIEDTKSNEKLKQAEKDSLMASLMIESKQKEDAINQTFADAQAAKTLEENTKKEEAQKTFEQRMFDLRAETIDKQIEAFRRVQEQELSELQTQLDAKLISEEQFQAAKKAIAEQTTLEINALNQEQADKEMALNKAVKDGALELASQALAGLAANMKEGSNAAKAVAVAQASMDTYRAATAAFASTAANPITTVFPAAPFIAAAAAVAMGVANVRKILSVTPQNGGGAAPSAAGGGSAPSFGSMAQQSTPQMNLNTNTANQNAGGESNRERVIVVDYHDIASKGNELQMSNQKVTLA